MADASVIYTMAHVKGNGFEAELCLDPANRRLRVDDYRGQPEPLHRHIFELAEERAFTKIFVKSHEEDWPRFLSLGYMLEGVYQGYFAGSDAYCMAVYLDPDRRTSGRWIEEDRLLSQVLALQARPERVRQDDGTLLRPAVSEDAAPLAALFGQIFRTYPTPMSDPSYVAKVLAEGTLFCVIEREGRIVSAASAEVNVKYRNAEITDCVTAPEERGQGRVTTLIRALEEHLKERNIHCAYSLSRATSYGMNAALFRTGYRYSGRLANNCDIGGGYEDMNLWVKKLAFV
ncbi:putative beta-lysine N-acetyltransferase [Cohnella candidum]|uniref:Putative beta-lysine N-acetyltransferase n=1 Tax=Cohnella candidum TaxID=2674991 RepID=A0A3G3JYV2_9BACL|nr:putative beta-lysine N-acetyltransferase [Cohnella candidum]AYQ73424.1 putative beta-lysine N-acetyltransferase [Cohnella candidum]